MDYIGRIVAKQERRRKAKAGLYARVNGPPDNWDRLNIFRNGVLIGGVVEVDCEEGWAIRYYDDHRLSPDGNMATYRDYANFRIEVMEGEG